MPVKLWLAPTQRRTASPVFIFMSSGCRVIDRDVSPRSRHGQSTAKTEAPMGPRGGWVAGEMGMALIWIASGISHPQGEAGLPLAWPLPAGQ